MSRHPYRSRQPDFQTQSALISIGSLTFRERQIVAVLRGMAQERSQDLSPRKPGVFANMPQSQRDAFGALVREAKSHDVVILAPAAPFMSLDENTIVRLLSALQRPSLSDHWIMANRFQLALKQCATALCETARRLPSRPIPGDGRVSRKPCFVIQLEDCVAGERPPAKRSHFRVTRWDGKSEPPCGTLKAAALDILRRKPVAHASDFVAVGITHQYLSAPHRQGYVERVKHGLYRFPTPQLGLNSSDGNASASRDDVTAASGFPHIR